jgi:hypothetical protein
MPLTPEENRELKRLLLKAAGWEGDPDLQPEPVIRHWTGDDPPPEGTAIVLVPTAQPQHGSAKVHGDKIDTDE